jgi:hypothetical protein
MADSRRRIVFSPQCLQPLGPIPDPIRQIGAVPGLKQQFKHIERVRNQDVIQRQFARKLVVFDHSESRIEQIQPGKRRRNRRSGLGCGSGSPASCSGKRIGNVFNAVACQTSV